MIYNKKLDFPFICDFDKTENYQKAIEYINNNADPNSSIIYKEINEGSLYDNDKEKNIMKLILESFWNGGDIDNKFINTNNKSQIIIDFFNIWNKKGGDLNTTTKNNDKIIDFFYLSMFPTLQIENKKDNHDFIPSQELHQEALNILTQINLILEKNNKLKKLIPLFQNKNVFGIMTKEGWTINAIKDIRKLSHKKKGYLLDENNNNPYHYSFDFFKENSFYSDPHSHTEQYNKILHENLFNAKFLLEKNKDNLIPIEKIFIDTGFSQIIPLYEKTLKAKPDFIIDQKFILAFKSNTLQKIESDCYSNVEKENLKNYLAQNIFPFIAKIEKQILNQHIQGSYNIDKVQNKKRM